MFTEWLPRIAMSALFLGGSIPIFIRAFNGVIPASDGLEKSILRSEEPDRYWRLMAVHLFIAIGITVGAVISWVFPLPS